MNNNIIIHNSVKNKVLPKIHFTNNEFISYVGNIKAIDYMICTELYSDNKTKYIEASIKWSYSSFTSKKNFEYSEDGLIKACEWIDEMRIKFIEELL